MKTATTTLFVTSLMIPLVSSAAIAAGATNDKSGEQQFKLYAHKSFAADVSTVDGAQITRPLDSGLVEQLGQARTQVNGTYGVRNIVPGRSGNR